MPDSRSGQRRRATFSTAEVSCYSQRRRAVRLSSGYVDAFTPGSGRSIQKSQPQCSTGVLVEHQMF